jgi:putative nucleotidyltransferase with HDIG domain
VTTPRTQLADELLRRLAATLRSKQLYGKGHPIISRNLESLSAAVQLLHGLERAIVLGFVGEEIIVDDLPIPKSDTLGGLVRRLKQIGVERATIERGVTLDELTTFVDAVTTLEPGLSGEPPTFPPLQHIRVGRVTLDQLGESARADLDTVKRLYNEAVSAAENIWQSAQVEGQPDVAIARSMIDGLAQAVSQNRSALLALTTLKNYDNYTFTHMVNVSILTMGQARTFAIDGPLLREFGLAALMHDIGKVRTPIDILNKPDKLTDQEFAIMKRHTIEGAEILRATPEVPTLAPVLAFEHHLRLDGSGYPTNIKRPTINLATLLCSIADVYDAMRSQRAYQKAFPTDRILEVLRGGERQLFDQHLVRRFVQLIGIYPVGNVVRLDTGALAIVTRVHAPDPHRPSVKVISDTTGTPLAAPYDLDLWEAGEGVPGAIVAPVDPAEIHVDPLTVLAT